ncbi:Ribokinase-like protein [Calocera cornea HHB12733]|uniref:Ribokinase-like protein n=1 Tax=Calocera cornea HHB12733 TaxID=1353952 RepID=A0A165H1C5_9BASI|nr:Ribokinase-like protein [Calocera cornea HHB12733]
MSTPTPSTSTSIERCTLVTLGMFIVDEFRFLTEDGEPTGKTQEPEIGGGGTYCTPTLSVERLPPAQIGMIVDRGNDFSPAFQRTLDSYGPIFQYRDDPTRRTTRAANIYRGELRGFEYLLPRVRISPKDLVSTRLEAPKMLHFICSPTRALEIIAELRELQWDPVLIYEPIPDLCIPEEMPQLVQVIPSLHILSPNADEALTLLSLPLPPTASTITKAATELYTASPKPPGAVIIRAGELGAYVYSPQYPGVWVPPCDREGKPVVDVTGAGNAFLGGLAAGLELAGGDVLEAAVYASVTAGFTIEQDSLPPMREGLGEEARRRLEVLRKRVELKK